MTWDLSCPDWADRLRAGRSLVPDLPLDRKEAERAVAIFNRLRLADVPGTPTLEVAAGEWFRDIVRALFGSLDPATGQRYIREILNLVPKKNSKTSYGALLMLTALLLNKRPKAKFIMTAPTQDITELAFNQAAGAIALDDVLAAKFHVRAHLKTIVHRQSGATLEIMTFDPEVLTGQKPAGILLDELHVCAKMSKASSAIRQLRGGMLPFPEAFFVFITTQSEEPPAGAFRAELLKARAIRDGRQTGAMLPVLYEFPEEMQQDQTSWRDPANWPMVTPNRGRSISIARLVEEFHTAATTGEDELRAWASQHLNVEVGLGLHSNRWSGADFWEQNADKALTLDEVLARSEVVVVGIDGGGLDDLLGLAVLGRCKVTRRWLLWNRAWAHRIVLDRRKQEAPRLLDFEREGDLAIVDQPGDDVAEVADIVMRVEEAGLLADKGIGVDAAGIGDIVDELTGRGIALERIIGVPQGWKLTAAIKTTERKLAGGDLVHGGRPLMAWATGNAKVEPKGNAVSITKQASGNAKIDPLMAVFDAVSLMALNPEPKNVASVYESSGFFV
ncbi:MAG TPA: terminase large subunit [Azospirillum sp.]|nr:terminase large subunit [Azospirillum sp.]